ncbi:DarT ssDNA thymidine ADP-ribosyltransferase family protein [Agromyces sp. NPDC057679]|uniref:DarT ssDNA thymidine ADP-ribosyltransferase family protein n=1 Tax=Agromyces sp. NPDC057679 TaxID=3346207 RepID=UPI00366EC8A0
MGDECIHGFDDGLCATCFPPKEPEQKVTATAPVRGSTRGSARTATASTRTASSGAGRAAPTLTGRPLTAPPVEVGTIRIYHVTHLDNLGRILGAGAILSDAGGANPAVDVAAPAVREFRRQQSVPGVDATLADYVPFLLTPDALVWDAVRTASPDPRLRDDAVLRPAADHVILVGSVAAARGALTEPGAVIVSDTDAALPGAELAIEWPDVERLLRRLVHADETARLRTAEFLARGEVPLERIALIAVGNDKVRDRVRAALAAVGVRAKVAVYPPWFQPAEIELDGD